MSDSAFVVNIRKLNSYTFYAEVLAGLFYMNYFCSKNKSMKKISKFILSLLLFMIVIPLSGNIPEENTIGDQIVLVRKENDGDSVLRSPKYFPFDVRLKDHTIYVYDNIGGLPIFVK